MQFYQWLVPVLSLFFIYRLISQDKNNKRLLVGTLLWVLFWVFIALLGIFPDFISFSIADYLGFKDNINAVIFVALGFLFLMTYYQSATIENLENQLTDLVRKMAMDKQKELEKQKEESEKATAKDKGQDDPNITRKQTVN